MPTAVLPDADVTDMSDVEFEIPCDVKFGAVCPRHNVVHGPVTTCDQPATFAGFMPCCGGCSYVCTPHRNDNSDWYCATCKREIPCASVKWIPL